MKLLIDANILLDVLQRRIPHYRDSALIWKLCETRQVEGWVSALTLANLVYVMRRELTPEQIEDALCRLGLIFHIADLTAQDIALAAAYRWNDYEDALQSVAAERIHADAIITRNVRDFRSGRIIARTPAEFLTGLPR